jgi:hypothetical protein
MIRLLVVGQREMSQSSQMHVVNGRSARTPPARFSGGGDNGGVQPPAPPARAGRSPRDMALSMAVLLIPIFIAVVVYRWLGGEGAVAVDPSTAYADARAAKAFPVAEVTVPKDWQPVSAAFRRDGSNAVLRVGFTGPGSGTAQLVEGNAADLVATELGPGARIDARAVIGGKDWQRYPLTDGEQAVVLAEPGRTVIIRGRMPDAQLVAMARSI